MSRTFCHLNEFREDALAAIPSLVYVSDPLVLWAPSFSYLSALYAEGITQLGPRSVLDLIEERRVVLMGREGWFWDRRYRARYGPGDYPHDVAGLEPAELRRWSGDFDSVVSRWAKQDEHKPFGEKRVITAGRPRGREAAQALVEKDAAQVQRAWQEMREFTAMSPVIQRMVSHAVERAESEAAGTGAEAGALMYLETQKNAESAFRKARADTMIAQWGGAPPVGHVPRPRVAAADAHAYDDMLQRVLALARAIPAFWGMTERSIVKVLVQRKYGADLRDWVDDMRTAVAATPGADPFDIMVSRLQEQLTAASKRQLRDLLRGGPLSWAVGPCGVLTGIMWVTALGMCWSVAPVVRTSLEVLGVPSPWLENRGPKWPFYCVLGRPPYSLREISKVAKAMSGIRDGLRMRP